jgi:Domain of unknown function (DUF4168)
MLTIERLQKLARFAWTVARTVTRTVVRTVRLRLAIVLVLWLGLNWTAVALAEPLAIDNTATTTAEQSATPHGVDSSNIPSEKVNQFVNACLQVVALIDRREGSLQGAETESESLRIEQEIEAEALGIIQQAGLTRQEYIQLLGLANTDPEFGERVAVQLQEATS